MEATQVKNPEWIDEILGQLVPLVAQNAQLVLRAEDTVTFGRSPKDEVLDVQINNAESVKTIDFATDGTHEDHGALSYADGWIKQRRVRDWNYVLVQNAVQAGDGQKVVQTVYLRSKPLFRALCVAIGRNPNGR